MTRLARLVVGGQAAYYVLTGLWGVLDRDTFQAITGPKADYWLVRMVGLLAAVIGTALALGARAGRWTPELLALAFGSALAFAAVDFAYGLAGRISPVYVADGVVELGLVALLAWSIRRQPAAGQPPAESSR